MKTESRATAPAVLGGVPSRLGGVVLALVRGVPAVLAVIAPFVAAYVALALVLPLPAYTPDEPLYEHLARSLAHGQGFTWRGDPVWLPAALYVYLLAPVWVVASGLRAYEIAKVETALFFCGVAVPVWILAKTMVPRRVALWAVALSLAGTWMASAGSLMTESLALPLATGSLAAAVAACRAPSSRLSWLAIALALLSAWARFQLISLMPILLMSLVVDVARSGRSWRRRAAVHRWPVLALATSVVVGGLVALVGGDALLGGYGFVLHMGGAPGAVVAAAGEHLLQLAALTGFLPPVLALSVAVRRVCWRDDVVGPLLAVLVPATLVTALQDGLFQQQVADGIPNQRYLIHLAPMLLLLVLVALTRPWLFKPRVVGLAFVLSFLLMLTPEVPRRLEQLALYSSIERFGGVLGHNASAGGVALLVALCLLGLVAAGLRRSRRSGPYVAAVLLGAGLLPVLLAQTGTVWAWQIAVQRDFRASMPGDLQWLDHHRHGNVAVLTFTSNWVGFHILDFFNGGITRYYTLVEPLPGRPVAGAGCRWRIAADGTARFPANCLPGTREFLIADPEARVTFYNEADAASDPAAGRLVRLSGDAVRLRSLVITPCDRNLSAVDPVTLRTVPEDVPLPCRNHLDAQLWLHRRGTLELSFQGGTSVDHAVYAGRRRYEIPPLRRTTVRVPVSAGHSRVQVDLDWAESSLFDPSLVGVVLEQDRRSSSLV